MSLFALESQRVLCYSDCGDIKMNKDILDRLAPITQEEQALISGGRINRSLYMEGRPDIINSKKLLSAGKLITVRTHTRFVHFPEHSHDYIEVVYMCAGRTTHIINGEKVLLREGELLFLSQNARQEILPAGREDIAVNFIILPQFFDGALKILGDEETPLRRFIINSLKSKNPDTSFLHFEVADVLPVQNLVENLIWTLISDTPNKRSINQVTMGLLFLQLMNCTDRLKYKNRQEEIVLLTLRYIEENYVGGSLRELARLTHYDFAWLSREIKRKTGRTYTELLQEKRLSQAAFLLAGTDLSVADISAKSGYDNISYFHRIFLKKFGMTPREYRIKIKQAKNLPENAADG